MKQVDNVIDNSNVHEYIEKWTIIYRSRVGSALFTHKSLVLYDCKSVCHEHAQLTHSCSSHKKYSSTFIIKNLVALTVRWYFLGWARAHRRFSCYDILRNMNDFYCEFFSIPSQSLKFAKTFVRCFQWFCWKIACTSCAIGTIWRNEKWNRCEVKASSMPVPHGRCSAISTSSMATFGHANRTKAWCAAADHQFNCRHVDLSSLINRKKVANRTIIRPHCSK